MKYDEKYKDVPIMELGDNTYLRCKKAHPCCVCGEPRTGNSKRRRESNGSN